MYKYYNNEQRAPLHLQNVADQKTNEMNVNLDGAILTHFGAVLGVVVCLIILIGLAAAVLGIPLYWEENIGTHWDGLNMSGQGYSSINKFGWSFGIIKQSRDCEMLLK